MKLTDGVEVRIRGRVDFYPPTGRLQLVMNGIDPVFTVGRLAADRERVLRVLAADGLLRAQRGARARPGTAAGRAGHERGERRLPRLPRGADGERLRVPGRPRRRPGPGRRRVAPDRLRAAPARPARSRRRGRRAGWRRPQRPRAVRQRDRRPRHRRAADPGASPGSATRSTAPSPTRSRIPVCKTPTAAAGLLVGRVDEFCARLSRISHRIVASGPARAARSRLATSTASPRRITRGAPAGLQHESERIDDRARARRRARPAGARARRGARRRRPPARARRYRRRARHAHGRLPASRSPRARLRGPRPATRPRARLHDHARRRRPGADPLAAAVARAATLTVEFADGTAITHGSSGSSRPDPQHERGADR